MDYPQNARLTVIGREQLARKVLHEGLTLKLAAASFNVSAKTAAKWTRRFEQGGVEALRDRSSRPRRCPCQTSPLFLEKVLALRRLRHNGWRIARELKLSRATVSGILRRAGMNRLRSLDPPPPVVRYEHKHPGDLIHFDIKRLARIVKPGHRIHGDRTRETRGAGYESLPIAIDDHTRIAFTAILPDQRHGSAILFFHMARAHFSRFGFSCRRVLTDNGSCYRDGRFRMLLNRQNIKHRLTRPYTPRTNGKAERFIQTALREWAYARSYQHSEERQTELDFWTHDYNFHHPHASLNLNSPVSRAGLAVGRGLYGHHGQHARVAQRTQDREHLPVAAGYRILHPISAWCPCVQPARTASARLSRTQPASSTKLHRVDLRYPAITDSEALRQLLQRALASRIRGQHLPS